MNRKSPVFIAPTYPKCKLVCFTGLLCFLINHQVPASTPPRKLTWLAGKSTMNETMYFPLKIRIFPLQNDGFFMIFPLKLRFFPLKPRWFSSWFSPAIVMLGNSGGVFFPRPPCFARCFNQSIKRQLGVPLTVYQWYLLCSLEIFRDYNPWVRWDRGPTSLPMPWVKAVKKNFLSVSSTGFPLASSRFWCSVGKISRWSHGVHHFCTCLVTMDKILSRKEIARCCFSLGDSGFQTNFLGLFSRDYGKPTPSHFFFNFVHCSCTLED